VTPVDYTKEDINISGLWRFQMTFSSEAGANIRIKKTKEKVKTTLGTEFEIYPVDEESKKKDNGQVKMLGLKVIKVQDQDKKSRLVLIGIGKDKDTGEIVSIDHFILKQEGNTLIATSNGPGIEKKQNLPFDAAAKEVARMTKIAD
jgi:hypothetical protein